MNKHLPFINRFLPLIIALIVGFVGTTPLFAQNISTTILPQRDVISEPSDYSQEYFTITSWEPDNTITFHRGVSNLNLYISFDKTNWSLFTSSSNANTTVVLGIGEKAYFKASSYQYATSDSGATNYSYFSATKLFEASGNIMSLFKGDDFVGATSFYATNNSYSYNLFGLFSDATTLLTLENLVLPVTQYNKWVFQGFASGCTSLIRVPKELPAQTFQDRNTLVWMFRGCPKIQESPVIRLTSNASGDGWHQMFRDCYSLKRVICLLEGTNLRVTGSAWLNGVPSGGVFYKNSSSTWQSGYYAVPSSWTTRNWSEDPTDFVKVTSTPAIRYSCYVEGTSDYYQPGDNVTLKCTPINGFTFNGWYVNGTLVSTDETYSFTAAQDIEITPLLDSPFSIITIEANPANGGTISGEGTYPYLTECTLMATASAGYVFNNWTEDGAVVSTDATYTFTVIGDRNLLANFIIDGNINFYDAYVKALCVANWDTNGDGELSYVEAASVTSLGDVFKNNTDIHSFNELQYFLSLGSIGEQAFYGCTELTQVTIPEQVTTVGSKAFWNCPALQTVRFNAINCTSMQTTYNSQTYSVFSEDASGSASNVKSVVLGTNVQRIPDYAFKDCVDIYPGLTIRNSVTEIGAHAFENCSSMTNLSFQSNSTLATIGNYAFNGCSSLNKALNLPNSVTTVGQYAFYGCVAIPSLTIGTSMKSIGGYAFWNCPAMATVHFNATNCFDMRTRQSSTNNYYSVFNSGTSYAGATPIVTLTIGESVTKIPDYAFRNSPNIAHAIVIPNATTYVGQSAFFSIHSTELTIGEGVETIGEFAFCNCPDLATVHFNATNCTTMVTNSQYSVFNSSASSVGATPIVTLTIGENVTNIPDYAFRNSTNMTSAITIPDATTTIGTYAFYGVQSTTLTIGTGVTSINGYAFWKCPNLATVNFNATNCTTMNKVFNSGTSSGGATPIVTLTIGSNVTRIPDNAFSNSPNAVGNLLLPAGLTYIGQYAFHGCSGFSGNLAIPNSVTTLGQYAFDGCSGFNGTLTLPVNESITTINSYTFNGCSGLSGTLTIPANVTSVGIYAFRNCSSFTGALVLHDAMESIDLNAFYGCSSISELTIGESVTTIGGYAFWNCPNLATVHFNATNCTTMNTVFNSGTSTGGATPIVTLTIGSNVTRIPDYAFRYSNNMTCDIIIPDAVTSIGAFAFANCSGHNVFTGKSVTNIPDQTFYQSSGFNGTLLLGDAVANIGQNAFQDCSGFTGDLTIPNSVTALGKYAFSGCSGFDGSLIIGRGVQTINQNTFANCSGFSGALILGTQVNSIGNNSFQNCNNFALVISENPNPITATSSSFTDMNFSIPVYVPDGLVSNYQNATGWSNFTNYIEQFTFWQELDTDNWSDEQNWLSGKLPGENDVVCITYNCDMDIDFDVLYVYVYNINDVLTIKANQTLYTTYGVGLMSPSQLVIEPGGQVIYGNGTNANGTQTLELSSGWNWVSFNVEITMDDLKAAIVAANPGAAPVIKSKGDGQASYNGAVWVGALRTLDLSQMYEIKVANACTVNLEGTRLNPADHPATIKNGANWIAYPLDEEMSVANAFAGFPVTGDNVKSKDGGQATWNGVMWLGALKNLVPGTGYIYNSKATGDKTLTF